MRTRIVVAVLAFCFAGGLFSAAQAQAPAPVQAQPNNADSIVGTWQLTGLEQAPAPGQPLAKVANPVGILIHAANGVTMEIVSQAARPATLDAAQQFLTYQASWGTFQADAKQPQQVAYHISGDLDPGRTGKTVSETWARTGTTLTMTELDANGQPVTRKTWERYPELESIPAYQQAAIGMWEWTSAGLYNDAGQNLQPAYRDASLILYTPTGHMAVVYLPPPGRKPFAGPTPTVQEAQAAWQGSVSYFGTYVVQPKSSQVFHYQLGAANPTAVGGWFMRNFEITDNGNGITLRFPPTMLNGMPVRNVLTLKRLAGLQDMYPDFKP